MHFEPVGIGSILIVDDHPLYCDALVATLERLVQPRDIFTATRLEDAMAYESGLDLVILDLKLPGVNGLDGFMQMREHMPDVPILVISAIASDYVIRQIKDLGGAGYINKSASHEKLQLALKTVCQGGQYFPAGIATIVDEVERSADDAPSFDLTPQQGRILRLICDGKPNKQIAYELDLAEATVKAHVTALLRRLGVRNRTQAAMLVQQQIFGDAETLPKEQ